jgi:geranylgeranyl pyrophosphate synthase
MSGALIAGVDDEMTQCFSRFGYALGLAFQVRDDILDETGDTNVMGKAKGSDQSNNKATFTSSHGLDYATAQLDSLRQQAIDALSPLGSNAQPLIMLANFVATRDH